MAKTAPLEKLRTCGLLETYSTARHHLGFYNNVGLTATYTTSSTSAIPLDNLVFAALHHVIAAHPNLSAIPVNEDKSYPNVYFAHLPEIDLRTCVEFRSRKTPISHNDEADQELDNILSEQHSCNFRDDYGTKPYWRFIITSATEPPEAFTASWIFHHALADGASALLFHESFLAGLNAAPSEKEMSLIVTTPHTPLLPPLEKLHPMTTSWPFFLRAVAGSLMPSYFAQRPSGLWTGEPVPPNGAPPLPLYHQSIVLSAAMTTEFAKICHAEQTSVTSTLSALIASGLFFLSPNTTELLKVDTPISLRPVLDFPAERMTNAITNASFVFTEPLYGSPESMVGGSYGLRTFSWDQARRMKQELTKEINKEGADNPIALLKYVSNMHTFFLEKLAQPRPASAEVSNLGVWRPGKDAVENKGRWNIGRMTFSQSVNHTSAPISVSIVTGGDGCLVLHFCWAEDKGTDDLTLVQLLVNGLKRDIGKLIKGYRLE